MLVEHAELEQGALPSIRMMLFAGEVFPTKYLSRLMKLLPHAEFANLYGPTETNVCTYHRVPEPPDESDPPIPIGRAIANVDTFVVDDDGREVVPGEVGELHVRGPTVMRGYWGDLSRTRERLVRDPRDAEFGDLVYTTGDLVQQLPEGGYNFLGRRDNQIKSRGYRIELGDIESAINAHPDVVECAVVAVPDEMISNRIHAFVAVKTDLAEPELIVFCADLIPKYMIPEQFDFRDALPKTSTGKIDRQSLTGEAAAEWTPPPPNQR
jgi:acyl-coenzyme A synthetase/AMP-(fatty) acid ligase